MISTPLRIENPVSRPIVPPMRPNWASNVTWKANLFVLHKISNLHISLNLIIGGCVKVDVHCLKWSVPQHSGCKQMSKTLQKAQLNPRVECSCLTAYTITTSYHQTFVVILIWTKLLWMLLSSCFQAVTNDNARHQVGHQQCQTLSQASSSVRVTPTMFSKYESWFLSYWQGQVMINSRSDKNGQSFTY